MKNPNIGIIGFGFVGAAVAHGFSAPTGYKSTVRIYDIDKSKSNSSLEEVVNQSQIVFISVPTPAKKDGTMHLDILESCLEEVSKASNNMETIFLIRSTVVPGTTDKLSKKFKNLNLVFNPEFLTERNAKLDFINQSRVILGGEKKLTEIVASLYRDRFGESLPIIETSYETAELTKYVCNNYFATKISFLNEMKLISDKVGADWEMVIDGFLRDGRIGHSHADVPGHDGKFGFGGACFPKDIQAMIRFGESIGIKMDMLEATWKTNLKVRDPDWLEMEGRAVVKED